MSQKPLFVPLKAEYYRDFECGMKKVEYRIYGPRWNERTCTVGRPVTLSLGYGKRERLRGTVVGFVAEPMYCLDSHVYREMRALFPMSRSYEKIACIGVEVNQP